MRGRAGARIWTLCAVLLAPALAGAQEPEELIGDRPDFTESSVAVSPRTGAGRGGHDVDPRRGRDRARARRGPGPRRRGGDLELRLGLGSWVGPATPRAGTADRSGSRPGCVEGWGRRPATGGPLGTATPFGDEEVADESWQPEAKLALGWELAEGLELGVNAGYARPGSGESRFDQAQWSAALGWGARSGSASFWRPSASAASSRTAGPRGTSTPASPGSSARSCSSTRGWAAASATTPRTGSPAPVSSPGGSRSAEIPRSARDDKSAPDDESARVKCGMKPVIPNEVRDLRVCSAPPRRSAPARAGARRR